jgi:cytochrome c-type biogenesis protein CcmH
MRRSLFIFSLLLLVACQGSKKDPAPASGSGTSPAAPAENSAWLSGKVELSDDVKGQADPLAVLFVIARNDQGQIAAVKKLLPPFQWPVSFSLAPSDAMIAGTELSGKLKLTARLDKDGNANPAQTGDILGKTEAEWVKTGDREVVLYLIEVVP